MLECRTEFVIYVRVCEVYYESCYAIHAMLRYATLSKTSQLPDAVVNQEKRQEESSKPCYPTPANRDDSLPIPQNAKCKKKKKIVQKHTNYTLKQRLP